MCKCIYIGMILSLLLLSGAGHGEEGSKIKLPAPVMMGGKPLMQVLKERHSIREFNTKALSEQLLSNLLWAAAGVNRPDTGKRTAPSARVWMNISLNIRPAEPPLSRLSSKSGFAAD